MKALQTITPKQYRLLEKSASNKVLIERFSDFMVALYRLHDYFPDSKMVGVRIENIRKAFFDLQNKLKNESDREADGFN